MAKRREGDSDDTRYVAVPEQFLSHAVDAGVPIDPNQVRPLDTDRLISLDEIIGHLNISITKMALKKMLQRGKLPSPEVQRGGSAPDLFRWSQMRPALVAEFGEAAVPINAPIRVNK
jgi:hypothetical protein